MKNNSSRRQFLRLGLTSAAVAPLAAMIPFSANAKENASSIHWDEEMDVLVLGTGMAGFIAAIKAAETTPDLKIVLADKMSRLGGIVINLRSEYGRGGIAVAKRSRRHR